MFLYSLTFSPFNTSLTGEQIRVFVEQNRDVGSWYYPFAGNIIFKSPLTILLLNEQFRRFFGPEGYVLAYCEKRFIVGMLPQPVWDWINEETRPAITTNSTVGK